MNVTLAEKLSPSVVVATNIQQISSVTSPEMLSNHGSASSTTAKKNMEPTRLQKKRKIQECEDFSSIHPIQAEYFKKNRKKVTKEDYEVFGDLAVAFLQKQAPLACKGHGKSIKCTCLKNIVDSNILSDAIQCMFHFSSISKAAQNDLIKSWIKHANTSMKRRPYFFLYGVFLDPPTKKTTYKVCVHAMLTFYGIAYYRYQCLRKEVNINIESQYGFKGAGKKYSQTHGGMVHLKSFFEEIKKEAEMLTIDLIRSKTGISLTKIEAEVLELPPHYSKRNVYRKYAWSCGFDVRADAKGNLPKVENYPLRPYEEGPNAQWTSGMKPRDIVSRTFFRKYWDENYKMLHVKVKLKVT